MMGVKMIIFILFSTLCASEATRRPVEFYGEDVSQLKRAHVEFVGLRGNKCLVAVVGPITNPVPRTVPHNFVS